MSRALPTSVRVRQVAAANLGRPFTKIAEAYRCWQGNRRNRRIIAGLTDAQLQDAGIDKALLLGNRASMEVKRGLMIKLMSMR